MNKYNANSKCDLCNGTGEFKEMGSSIHSSGKHTCICVTEQYAINKEPEDMTKQELIDELKDWRKGRLYRGIDKIKADNYDKMMTKVKKEI